MIDPDYDSSEDWADYLSAVDQEKDAAISDLDPLRTVTYLENGVPYCYLGHPECYDIHADERAADDVDYRID